MTVAQATKYATAATASGNFVPETLGAQANANAITNYYGTSYGKEDVYIAMVLFSIRKLGDLLVQHQLFLCLPLILN